MHLKHQLLFWCLPHNPLPLLSMLSQDGFLAKQAMAADGESKYLNPLAPKKPHFQPKAKSVIFLFMYGGPSHIDTLDPKPHQPDNNRGPFLTIPTTHPGIRVCEHLPKYAKLTKKLTMIRSVDCRSSSHQPNQVMQTGNRAAAPRTNREGKMYPAIGSVVAKLHGANREGVPANVNLNLRDRTHFAWGGWLGL